MTRVVIPVAVCLAMVVTMAMPARADLVVNGDFETENLVGGIPVPPPHGWSISGGGVSIDATFPYSGPYDISFSTLSNDPDPGTLSQTLMTVPGTAYKIELALFDESGAAADTFTVALGAFSATITGDEASAYTVETLEVPGSDISGGTTQLSFMGISDDSAWNLDDVAVTESTPIFEPSSIVLLGAAFLACALRRPRR